MREILQISESSLLNSKIESHLKHILTVLLESSTESSNSSLTSSPDSSDIETNELHQTYEVYEIHKDHFLYKDIRRFIHKYKISFLPSYRRHSNMSPCDNQSLCPICMNDFTDKDYVRPLHCGHRYHKKCIDRWLMNNHQCPICRDAVFKSHIETITI